MATIAPLFTWRTAVGASDLSSSEKLVAYVISFHANEFATGAFPSHSRVCELSSLSRRTVVRTVASLTVKGWLQPEPRVGRSNYYTLCVPQMGEVSPVPRGGCHQFPGGLGNHDTHNSSSNSSLTPGATKKKSGQEHRALFAALCDWMGRPPSGGEGALWGRIAKLMAQEGVPPGEIAVRGKRMTTRWSTGMASPQALWNHWGEFAEPQSAQPREVDYKAVWQEVERELNADAGGHGEGPGGSA